MYRKQVDIDVFSHMIYENMIPKNHKLREMDAVSDFSMVEGLVEKTYASGRRGAPGYDPCVLFRILILRRIYNLSLRKVLDRCQTDVAFRWFAQLNLHDELPSKATLSAFRFRLDNRKLLKVFQGTVRTAKALGLITSTKFLVDGTVVKGNFKPKRQGRLMMTISIDLLKRAELWGQLRLPKSDSLEERIAFAKATLELLNTAELTPRLKRKRDLLECVIKQNEKDGTPNRVQHIKDCDARTTVRRDKKKVGYTALIGMDSASCITTVVKTIPANQEEGQHLLDLVNEHVSLVGEQPKQVLADTSFGHGANLKELLDQDVLPLIPPRSSYTPGIFHGTKFTYDKEEKTLRCPAGHVTANQRPFRGGIQFRFSVTQCKECPLKSECTTSKFRRVEISQYDEVTKKVRSLLDSKYDGHHKERMKVEYKFSQTKRFYGMGTSEEFSLDATERQVTMTFLVTNLVTMAARLFPKKKRARFALSLT